jgi:signal transduction histidine kinase
MAPRLVITTSTGTVEGVSGDPAIALIDAGTIIAASPLFLARLGLVDAADLEARGGLAFLAPGLAAGHAGERVRLTLPAEAPADAEVVPLVAAGGGISLSFLRLLPKQAGTDWPFLAKLSHELRTPLTSVIGFAELMGAESFGPLGHGHYRGYVGDILTSARHALSLVNDLLDLARMRAGHIDLAPARLDPDGLARETVTAMQPRALQAGVRLECAFLGAPVELIADRRSVTQILLNLLSNALNWTPAGGRVDLLVRNLAAGGLTFEVSDTGPGMSEAALAASLADPFAARRAPGAPGGSGLGLPLARELAQANGAALSFDTSQRQGLSVTLRFPSDKLREIKTGP